MKEKGKLEIDRYCSFCGQKFLNVEGYPRRCDSCGKLTFRNPAPVGVLLVPIRRPTGPLGVVTVRRNIQPGFGELALPGGYLEPGETWQAGAAREFFEESGVKIDPDTIRLLDVHSAPNDTLLIFGESAPLAAGDLSGFFPTSEVQELVVIERPVPLAFDLHEKVVADFFSRLV